MLFFLFLFSCRYHLHIQTTPASAEVVIRDTIYVATKNKETHTHISNDIDIRIWKIPFQKLPVEIRASGYRTLFTTLQLQRRRLLSLQSNRYQFILISDHQGAGSWTTEEVLEKP